ncbi:sulfotransferase family 2 domain-containing protein [Albimonas sp. CAU 1670]|uniref:sulfotransferase family 2 domain-containing protein n=1 Tax=Albimonas sp. CAU 1670 TaxID=3032599 RepID=UPI0023DC1C35|nr:sulfotransferase family 2 domain-containing protein [Albimonas sp. CAU 1670]MDF2232690.1 sulfotransferase family 2 domain-containing protein [Albimonas sp. CAU 1670]
MIISDAHRMAFVHIPKCAGTSLRDMLAPFHDQSNVFEFWHQHPRWGGRIDLMHVPMAQLVEFFPFAYAKVHTYRSFAVVREPKARFVSSLAEHLRHRTTKDLPHLSYELVRRTARKLIRRFRAGADPWRDVSTVHFQRQVDYVALNGQRVVDLLVPMERVDDIPALLEAQFGLPIGHLEVRHANRTWGAGEDKKRPRRPQLRTRAVMWSRSLGLGPAAGDAARDRLLEDAEIASFIADYYAEDAELYASARGTLAASQLQIMTFGRLAPAVEKDAPA